jgi:hypothetical protein
MPATPESMFVPEALAGDKLDKRTISHDGDYDPNYRSAQRIIKKMKLRLYSDPILAARDDADEL